MIYLICDIMVLVLKLIAQCSYNCGNYGELGACVPWEITAKARLNVT